jgi:hypothetical protein
VCRYAVSSWHQLADSSERFAHRRLAPGWLFRAIAWVFRRLGAASAHPSAREYLAPLRMKVLARPLLVWNMQSTIAQGYWTLQISLVSKLISNVLHTHPLGTQSWMAAALSQKFCFAQTNRTYLASSAPHGAQVSKAQWVANVLFWVVVLGGKVAFDYFAIIRPLKLPMRALWDRGFLRSGGQRPPKPVPVLLASRSAAQSVLGTEHIQHRADVVWC